MRAAGGEPHVLAQFPEGIAADLDGLDGLIFSGGADVDPARYGRAAHPATVAATPLRDEYELQLARAAFARHTPTLGICRGIQVLNVASGGELIQHVPDLAGHAVAHALPDDDPRQRGLIERHVVATTPGSRLARIAGAAIVTGSRHHQAVDAEHLGDGLRIVARTSDGIVEGLESADPARFWLGVQWHPESTLDDAGASLAIFRALVRCARGASG